MSTVNQRIKYLCFFIEYINLNVSVGNFCLNVFETCMLLQLFPTSHN